MGGTAGFEQVLDTLTMKAVKPSKGNVKDERVIQLIKKFFERGVMETV